MKRDVAILMGWIERSLDAHRRILFTPEVKVTVEHNIRVVISAMQARGQLQGVSLGSVTIDPGGHMSVNLIQSAAVPV